MANSVPPSPAAEPGEVAGQVSPAQREGGDRDRGARASSAPRGDGDGKSAGRSGGGGEGGGERAGGERVVLDDVRIRRALMRIAHEIVESSADQERLYLVAIPNGGVPLGRILVGNLADIAGVEAPMGILDTTLYRDDLGSRGTRPRLRRTEMPSSVDDRVVVLVEDVVNTGRTIRAAMDALMDFGRPRSVKVVALVDRGHRELPIKIDFVGKNIPTQPGETVKLRIPDGDGIGDSNEPVGGTPVGSLEVVVLRDDGHGSGAEGASAARGGGA